VKRMGPVTLTLTLPLTLILNCAAPTEGDLLLNYRLGMHYGESDRDVMEDWRRSIRPGLSNTLSMRSGRVDWWLLTIAAAAVSAHSHHHSSSHDA